MLLSSGCRPGKKDPGRRDPQSVSPIPRGDGKRAPVVFVLAPKWDLGSGMSSEPRVR